MTSQTQTALDTAHAATVVARLTARELRDALTELQAARAEEATALAALAAALEEAPAAPVASDPETLPLPVGDSAGAIQVEYASTEPAVVTSAACAPVPHAQRVEAVQEGHLDAILSPTTPPQPVETAEASPETPALAGEPAGATGEPTRARKAQQRCERCGKTRRGCYCGSASTLPAV